MVDNVSNAASLGLAIYNPVTGEMGSGISIGDSAFEFGSGLLDSTPLGMIIELPIKHLENGFSQIEKIKIIETTKQNFHIYVSQKVANSVSSFTTPSVNSGERSALLDGKSGQEWMSNAEQIYKTHQDGRAYKIQRKLQDTARVLKKNPIKMAKIPLSLVPLGETANLGIKVGEYVAGKYAEARKVRKKEGYLAAGNRVVLEQKLGVSEYNRKKAKWIAKDIAELGPVIQRNLYKLKQSVQVLNARSEHLNVCVQRVQANNPGSHATLSKSRESAAMSLYEVKHYIEKISEMCKTMEATAFTIHTYMEGLKQVTDDCNDSILKTF